MWVALNVFHSVIELKADYNRQNMANNDSKDEEIMMVKSIFLYLFRVLMTRKSNEEGESEGIESYDCNPRLYFVDNFYGYLFAVRFYWL